MSKFRRFQEDYYQEDIEVLLGITEPDHLFTNPVVESFRSSEFAVSVASTSYALFRRFVRDNKLAVIQSILKDQIHVDCLSSLLPYDLPFI